jgi:ribonuclease HII
VNKKATPSLQYEKELACGDDSVVIMGIDEAGRGPLAGEVFAAAVSLPLSLADSIIASKWTGINDSKKLSASKREELAAIIKETPQCTYAITSASPAEIDTYNILGATHLAMRRAARELSEKIGTENCKILVDGLPVKSLPFASMNLVKGDAKSVLIAAASILAKTARDESCLKLDEEYPEYGFAIHKGYPTKLHMEVLERIGPCPAHRQSFGPVAEALFFHGGKLFTH